MKNIKEAKGILKQVHKILENVYDEDLEYHGLESLEDMIDDAIFLLDKEGDTKVNIYKIMQGNMGKDFSLLGRPDPNGMLYALKGIHKYIREDNNDI